MTRFIVKRHCSVGGGVDDVSLWDDLKSAKAKYRAEVCRHRKAGLADLKELYIPLARDKCPDDACARSVFANRDGSRTSIVLRAIRGRKE